jgi:flagellar hook assembly protein FlgD
LSAISNGEITLTNDVFSPDNDGFEDILQISYEMKQTGLLGKARIFDDRGRLVRNLFSNELLGTNGTFSWDGLTDSKVKASIGVYVILFEAFSTDGGEIFATKKALTLAGRL